MFPPLSSQWSRHWFYIFTDRIGGPADAEILCFTQGDAGLQLVWRSPALDASARDLLADRSTPAKIRFAVASRDRTKILSAAAQWRVLWVK